MTKLDRMDIKCVRDYSPLSNAELMAEIEFYVGVAFDSPLRDPDPEEVLGPARALMARAEAAETERNRLQRELSAAVTRVAELKADYAEENRLHAEAEARAAELERVNGEFYRAYLTLKEEDDAGGEPLREACRQNMILTARVAKLEAALAAERAAHAWRPVTEPPQEPGWYQTVDAWGDHAHASWDGEWKYPATPRFIYWQPIAPLPTAPNVQEPTP